MPLRVQPWEEWRPAGIGPMRVLGVLPAEAYEDLQARGWTWDDHEEEYEDLTGVMVLLLERDGRSRFMLEAAPSRPDLGVQILGPANEPAADLLAELRSELALQDTPVKPDSAWPEL